MHSHSRSRSGPTQTPDTQAHNWDGFEGSGYALLLLTQSGAILEATSAARRLLGITKRQASIQKIGIWPGVVPTKNTWRTLVKQADKAPPNGFASCPGALLNTKGKGLALTCRLKRHGPAKRRQLYTMLLEVKREPRETKEESERGQFEFRDFKDFFPDGYYRLSTDGVLLEFSRPRSLVHDKASERKVRNYWIGRKYDPKCWFVDPARYREFMRRLRAEGQVSGFESERYPLSLPQDRGKLGTVWGSESAREVRDQHGRLLYIEGMSRDITSEIEARKALEKTRQEFEDFKQLFPDSYYRVKPNGELLALSRLSSLRHLKPNAEELVRLSKTKNINPMVYKDRARRREFTARLERDGEISNFISKMSPIGLKDKDGKQATIWVSESARAIRDEKGNTVCYEGITRDVTELIKAREDLQALNKSYREFLSLLPDEYYKTATDGRLIDVNDAAAHVNGYETAEEFIQAINSGDLRRGHYVHPKRRREWMNKVMRDGYVRSFVSEVFVFAKKGDPSQLTRWISESTRAARDNTGKIAYLEGVAHDITEIVNTRDALSRAAAEAEEANRSKSKFIAAVSHDLRQPLDALKLMAAELAAAPPQETHAIAERMNRAIARFSDLFTSLLDLGRIEGGEVHAHARPFQPIKLFARLRADLIELAHSREHKLTLSRSKVYVKSDPILLERILRNLLHNALAHTRAGEISVRCKASGHWAYIDITDTGKGLPQYIQKSFLRGSAKSSSGHHGFGLQIVQRLCEIAGIEISLERTGPGGTCFRLRVPKTERPTSNLKTDVTSAENLHVEVYGRPGRVMVIDDDQDFAKDLASYLNRRGLDARIGESLQDVIARDEKIDALVIDFHLGNSTNGYHEVMRLRNCAKRAIPTVIISSAPEVREQIEEDLDLAFLEKTRIKKALVPLLSVMLDIRARH